MEIESSADARRVSGQHPAQGAHGGFLLNCGPPTLLHVGREPLGAAVAHDHSVGGGRTFSVSEHRCAKPPLPPEAARRPVATHGHSRPCSRASLPAEPAWSFSSATSRALQTASIRGCESARRVRCQGSEGRP